MKFLKLLDNYLLSALTLLLLVFIPLYPKIPLLDVKNTWVYIRVEDVLVTLVVLVWTTLLITKKVSLRTPLTLPIMIFWIIAGISTLHGVMLIFPTLSDVFSNVAFLSYLRRIEYLFLFFVAFAGVKDKKYVNFVIWTLVTVFLLVCAYGFGQKYLSFPAYLTMNEEFAKGIPIQLSALSRVPSTFAGHYDLAAYLVLIIPILTSLFFGFKNILIKMVFCFSVLLGFILLFMTVSRVSFVVLLVAMILVFIMHKKKTFLATIFALGLVLLIFVPGVLQKFGHADNLLARYGNTLKEVNVLVDTQTGKAIGHVNEVDRSYFAGKTIYIHSLPGKEEKTASNSALILPFEWVPPRPVLLVVPNESTGENLPQGTGYINLPLSPVIKRTGRYFFEDTKNKTGTQSARIVVINGDYVVKRALAYDLSFTTRFQGEWPKTILAFKRNILLGSGYASVTLAVDNNYLRILGESGLLGFAAFISIFIVAGIFIKKTLPKVDSPVTRAFVFGFVAGSVGLALNALFIDVFEASKVAFTYWLLMGVTLGTLYLYKEGTINLLSEFKKVVTSPISIIIYLFILTYVSYSSISSSYFVGDDFTWLRWAADCGNNLVQSVQQCNTTLTSIFKNFTETNGFFYRPGAKIYFEGMYSVFWLNQTVFHTVSIFLHFLVAVLIFLITRKTFKNYSLSVMSSVIFLILSGHSEAIYWISATGFLFTTVFVLASLLSFIYWKDTKKSRYFILCIMSMVLGFLFHELGVVAPLLIILCDVIFDEKQNLKKVFSKTYYAVLLVPLVPYFVLRYYSHSHWLSGDYNYDLLKFPVNAVGNVAGYLALAIFGPSTISSYTQVRMLARDNIVASVVFIGFALVAGYFIYKFVYRKIASEERKILTFAVLFFVISLLPFLGLGNIAYRYSYLASFGVVIILAVFIKKLYGYLLFNGRNIALGGVILVSIVFLMLHLFQLQKLRRDWYVAGETSKKFLTSLNGVYDSSSAHEPKEFYFVNVPIRHGDAWIFPVGLSDALWFTFQNENLHVNTANSLEQAFDFSQDQKNSRVFLFKEDGAVEEFVRIRGEITRPPKLIIDE